MKYLLLVAVVVAVLWFVRARAKASALGAARTPEAVEAALPMVTCIHCGVHLPRAEALVGAQGVSYCSEAHRIAHGEPREAHEPRGSHEPRESPEPRGSQEPREPR